MRGHSSGSSSSAEMKFIVCSALLALAVTIESKKSQEVMMKCVSETKISLDEVAELGKKLKGKPEDDPMTLRDSVKEVLGEEKMNAFLDCLKTNFMELFEKCSKTVSVTDDEKTKLDSFVQSVLDMRGGSQKVVADKMAEILGAERAQTLQACVRKEMDE